MIDIAVTQLYNSKMVEENKVTANGSSANEENTTSEEKDIATETTVNEATEEKKEELIEHLYILPPKIPNNIEETRLQLPPLRLDEPISSIKAVLSEVLGYAHITNYRLILEKDQEETKIEKNGKERTLQEQVLHPYTSQAIILPPPTKEIVLDDYTDLSSYITHINNGYKCIRVVLQSYNLSAVKDHVTRIRSLVDGNCPHLEKLIMEEVKEEEEVVEEKSDVEEEKKKKKKKGKKKKKDEKENQKEEEKDLSTKAAELLKELSSKLPNYSLDEPLTKNYDNLEYFYKYSCNAQEKDLSTYIKKMQEYDSKTQVPLKISMGNLPNRYRSISFNDVAYLNVDFGSKTFFVTAIPSGFYLNRSTGDKFDPRPLEKCHYSHSLLDCILLASADFQLAWSEAMKASKERATVNNKTSTEDTPLYALYRIIQRSFHEQKSNLLDSVILKPCWLLPPNTNQTVTEDESMDMNSRCWNEEYQSGREMPKGTLQERIDRARVLHKVQVDFTDAAIQGVKHIVNGFIVPMNPSECYKSHVYLFNNIFFSRAVDATQVDGSVTGAVMETFKIAKGDAAARKSASRDVNCINILHKMDIEEVYTLLTVLVDYMGTRYVCQSVVPGILHGEKTHELLCGAVEANSPLIKNDDFHKLLLNVIGKQCRVATREVPIHPLDDSEENAPEKVIDICVPMEAKGIQGSDKRKYILDLTRVTPRDANWVTEGDGGTGNWEKEKSKKVPEDLGDDEWTMAVLRPELITMLTKKKMAEFLKSEKKDEKEKEVKEESNDKEKPESEETSSPRSVTEKENETKSEPDLKTNLTPEQEEYLTSLQYNVNVFLPKTQKSVQKYLSPSSLEQYTKDEEYVREASNHLWNDILPSLTQEIRENSLSQSYSLNSLPVDGKSLKELLHFRGINLRYIGRLAQLAYLQEEEDKALAKDTTPKLRRKNMPQCWLELLEVEMVARATRHVVNKYFIEMEEGNASQELYPAQIISSVLSAIVSKKEESAADTEKRLAKEEEEEEENDTFYTPNYYPNENKISRDRCDIWNDIEEEIGRRYRYTLHLFNRNNSSNRTLYLPLLRRVCQKCGIRLASRNYNLGGKSFTSSKNTYPIAPKDVIDILPLIKHSGASSGFTPCSFTSSSSCVATTLHIMLPDATTTQQAAHLHYKHKSLSKALDAAQDAASLYQRVVDTALHVDIAVCLDLSAIILFAAQELDLAAGNAARSLALYVQLFGPDCMEVVTCHTTLAHILLTSSSSSASSSSGDAISFGIQHLRNALYLMQIMGGPNYIDISSLYHKLGTMYHEVGSGLQALRFYQEALTQHGAIYDKMLESMITKSIAMCCSALRQYKSAFEYEKRAYTIYNSMFGEKHELTVSSSNSLGQFMKLAVAQGSKLLAEQQSNKNQEDSTKKEDKNENEIDESLFESEEDNANSGKKKKPKKKRNKKKN